MLKSGTKRRRTIRQITDEKAEEALRQQAIEDKLANYEKIQQELNEAKQEANNGKAATIILEGMINRGEAELDDNGNVNVKPQIIDSNQVSEQSQQQENSEMIQSSNGFQI